MDEWQITSRELASMMCYGRKLYIIDIRSKEQYDKGHIDGAVNMYYDDETDECLTPECEHIIAAYIKKGYRIVVYCSHGSLGMMCVRTLRKHNIMAYNLYGGFEEYSVGKK